MIEYLRTISATLLARVAMATIAVLVFATACGREPADGDPAQTSAPQLPAELASLEAAARDLPVVEGQSTDGDIETRYRAYLDGDAPVLLDEEVVTGEYGATRDRYFFDQDRLVFFHREGSQLIAMPPDPPGLGDVVMFVAFDELGRPVEQMKRLKGRPVPIETFELTAIGNRARQLGVELRARQRPQLAAGEYEGYLILGEPLATFQPCGDPKVYWVDTETDEMKRLRTEYDRVVSRPREPVYVRVTGEFGERATTGMASNYPAILKISAHSALSPRDETSCQ
ncbi:MAG: hypothetical protein WBN78_10380 [Gammaproteobacteria bacterium]